MGCFGLSEFVQFLQLRDKRQLCKVLELFVCHFVCGPYCKTHWWSKSIMLLFFLRYQLQFHFDLLELTREITKHLSNNNGHGINQFNIFTRNTPQSIQSLPIAHEVSVPPIQMPCISIGYDTKCVLLPMLYWQKNTIKISIIFREHTHMQLVRDIYFCLRAGMSLECGAKSCLVEA